MVRRDDLNKNSTCEEETHHAEVKSVNKKGSELDVKRR
jgi:hypothetical protein